MIHASFEGIIKNFCMKPVRHTGDTARRSDTEIAHFTQLQLQCKIDSVVCAADVGRQHSCLLRSFSCIAIFQLSRFTRFPLES